MGFSENLKQLRKDRGLSQEDLAELLGVSRQAVSKWEQGEGYPEAEKLLFMSKELNISLDSLLDTGFAGGDKGKKEFTGEIIITSPNEGVIVKCVKVASSQEFKTGKNSPKYALYGVSGASALGENSTFLGWYADKKAISEEIAGIQSAMNYGEAGYELKFSVKTETRWGAVKLLE
ncbi:MAG: helix-turn-helix transcriptional regulator [Eubacteriaceae bacterium]|nr:helix-turn-helix transcriptional regulator [Eubacteriaceae bacterium]